LTIFLGKVFDMDFLNSPCRETPKNVLKKKVKKKKSDGGWLGLGFSKCTGGSVDLFWAAPRNHGPGPSGPRGLRSALVAPASR
jgi:hypothetical protein